MPRRLRKMPGLGRWRWCDQRLTEAVNPALVTPDGWLRPFTRDFPGDDELGRLDDLAPDRRIRIARRLRGLRKLVARSLHGVELEEGFIDWFAFQRDQARLPQMALT